MQKKLNAFQIHCMHFKIRKNNVNLILFPDKIVLNYTKLMQKKMSNKNKFEINLTEQETDLVNLSKTGNVKSNYVNRRQSGSSSIPLMMHTTWSPANKIGMKTFHLIKDESGMRKNDGSINYPNKLFFLLVPIPNVFSMSSASSKQKRRFV